VAGHPIKSIGSALGIEERTVKAHVAKLNGAKLECRTALRSQYTRYTFAGGQSVRRKFLSVKVQVSRAGPVKAGAFCFWYVRALERFEHRNGYAAGYAAKNAAPARAPWREFGIVNLVGASHIAGRQGLYLQCSLMRMEGST